MKKAFTFSLLASAILALGACKSDEERRTEEIKQQELTQLKNTKRSADTWAPPNLSEKK